MWKRKNIQQENVNFLNWMNVTAQSVNHMMTIADVENGMKTQVNPSGAVFQNQQQHRHLSSATNQTVPQFFHNTVNSVTLSSGLNINYPFATAPAQSAICSPGKHVSGNFLSGNIPSQEQLHQHCGEIMRNAIMRKQRKFPK